ncbi:hypothetical protein LJC35_03865 [Parabacteroides sp. OttesenSCG-928-N08]|nr:hypothetical protein [Parabacteroides sp. OttesenSCG-928-N08]
MKKKIHKSLPSLCSSYARICLTLFMFPSLCIAQTTSQTTPFRRSSLYTFMVKSDKDSKKVDKDTEGSGNIILDVTSIFTDGKREVTTEDSIPKSELIQSVFASIEIPEQFNDHNLDLRVMDFDAIELTQEEIDNVNQETTGAKKKSSFGKMLKGVGAAVVSDVSGGTAIIDTAQSIITQLPAALKKFYLSEQVPAQLVAKWFNYSPEKHENGLHYNTLLLQERGLENASEADKELALTSSLGDAVLRDAGRELIPNTFVMALRLEYKSIKEVTAQAQNTATGIAALTSAVTGVDSDLLLLGTQLAGAAAGIVAGDGYVIQATSFLYQLDWNDELYTQFNISFADKTLEELIEADICKLKFVGKDKSSATVRSSRFTRKSESEIIRRATARAIDAVIANLQTSYEVFRTKAKIDEIDEAEGLIYAKIGLKEGIAKGDEYAVLEKNIDPETSEVVFKKVGSVKAVENQIWDNRYEAEEEMTENVEFELGEKSSLTATAFKGKTKGLHKGMYLQLEKKKK